MPDDRLAARLAREVEELARTGLAKGDERIIRGVLPPAEGRGRRYLIEGQGERPFLRMNANSYLGLSFDPEVIAAGEAAVRAFGAGPGAVRFISGTFAPHVALEAALARFHGREATMIFSSAYATMLGILTPLIDAETGVLSDELNHNCIINAIRLARPAERRVYPHLDLAALDRELGALRGRVRRAVVVTDGVFSMRGDHAPLDRVMEIARAHDPHFPENVLVVVDDSHGVAAFGAGGRGTEEVTGARADLLVGTLGKGFGVNGGYVTGDARLIRWLREKAPCYIYSNPIGPGEAAAALKSVEIVDGPRGRALLAHLAAMTRRFEEGITRLGLETIPGPHPVVPLMVRDTARTARLVAHLFARGILATGLAYPVVPKGDEEIRFQVSAEHTEADIDEALAALAAFPG